MRINSSSNYSSREWERGEDISVAERRCNVNAGSGGLGAPLVMTAMRDLKSQAGACSCPIGVSR
jgi:hypothetical protein